MGLSLSLLFLDMSGNEQYYIDLCKRQLETKFSFGPQPSERDLEQLSRFMETEKGDFISLSTLKRLWRHSFNKGPQLATLDALARALDHANWQAFMLAHPKEVAPSPQTKTAKRFGQRTLLVLAGSFLLVVLLLSLLGKKGQPVSIKGPVTFAADHTVDKGVPTTFVFHYDLSHVVADSFFIQQSWNAFRRERIDPTKHTYTSTYTESGYHRAKLIANDSIIARFPVHIWSDGWEPHVYFSEGDDRYAEFRDGGFVQNGILSLSDSLLLSRNVDLDQPFETRVNHSADYGADSNTFGLHCRVRLDSVKRPVTCPAINMMVVTEKHIFYVNLVRKGCERFAGYKLGEIIKNGSENDLSALGTDLYQWQNLGLEVKNRHAQILINGQVGYEETFSEDFGQIKGMAFIFSGKGSIDSVGLTNASGAPVYSEDFSDAKVSL